MEKTKLGISVELLAVIVVLASYFGGYTGMFLVVGYVLIVESDEWLKKLAVKAAVITLGFTFLSSLVHLIPNVVSCLNMVLGIIDIDLTIEHLSWLVNSIDSVLSLVEKFIFLIMAYMAISHNTFDIPVVDKFVAKHMGEKVEEVVEAKAEEKTEEKAEEKTEAKAEEKTEEKVEEKTEE